MKLDKETVMSDGRKLLAYWANNRGRGSDNCTLQVVGPEAIRQPYSRQNSEVLAECRTSSWRGDVNVSRAVREALGITGELTSR